MPFNITVLMARIASDLASLFGSYPPQKEQQVPSEHSRRQRGIQRSKFNIDKVHFISYLQVLHVGITDNRLKMDKIHQNFTLPTRKQRLSKIYVGKVALDEAENYADTLKKFG